MRLFKFPGPLNSLGPLIKLRRSNLNALRVTAFAPGS